MDRLNKNSEIFPSLDAKVVLILGKGTVSWVKNKEKKEADLRM